MLQHVWNLVLSADWTLLRSPFFFLLIAQCTQFFGCCFFSVLDLRRNRISLDLMSGIALNSALGFLPFIAMWWLDDVLFTGIEQDLPTAAPSFPAFIVQFALCAIAGDFCHYWTHRVLHGSPTLRNNIHCVHHEYEGTLYSWIGMQVHPVEVFMITLAIYMPFLLFAHPMVLWCFAFMATANATFAHSGYEGGFASLGVPHTLTSSDHQVHHNVNSTKNFGNIFSIWDMAFATYSSTTKYKTLSIW